MAKNKEIEESMKLALAKLKNQQREEAEKQYKKHWREMKFPFTLHEGLSKYTKYELDAVKKSLKIKMQVV